MSLARLARPLRIDRCARLAALALLFALPVLTLLPGCAATIDGKSGGQVDALAVFARLKTLAGSYQVAIEGMPAPTEVSYETVSGGHALLERLNVGAPEEMVSIYFLEGTELAMVHYCGIGNRPHLRLDRTQSTSDRLVFTFDPTTTGIEAAHDAHIHGAVFKFVDADTIDVEWDFWDAGASQHKKVFPLRRRAGSFTPPAGS